MADEIITQDNDEPQNPLWDAPTIKAPKPNSTVSPGFQIIAGEYLSAKTDWRIHIMQGDKLVREFKAFGVSVYLDVPYDVIPQGEAFYFKVDYYKWPSWSNWAYSGDLLMAELGDPTILKPVDNEVVTIKNPEVSGIGVAGANIVVKTADHSMVVCQTTVNSDGTWRDTLSEYVSSFPVAITARQTFRQLVSGWSNIVNINYLYSDLKAPVILKPLPNAYVKRTEVVVSGNNCAPGAKVNLYKAGSGVDLHGTGTVQPDGTWTINAKPELLFIGPFQLTVQQVLDGKPSGYSDTVKIILTI
ncbi:hypothetical protein [Pseudomonas sp. NPDC087336]|uniref:hypothetical protein n=1 Tax=Pseudomonas sp. NPDC087336 TaxID=3364436 RepID=UPI0037F12E66